MQRGGMSHKNSARVKKETDGLPEKITDGQYNYQIGAEIGKGGFAVVYQAFNVELGEFYAVKRFPLNSIDAESLGAIEAEIELMKELNHPNIVRYVDTIRTAEYLYIVLEYMENGSLQSILKKFGHFSESLAAIYIVQVLRGLRYLHDQGVLHRDIKGANILTSKDGRVKLADFGVAMKLSDAPADDEQYVVGTPYWMAPEIIEMSTPTPKCDIWSVGCTIIELLTGKPPYFELDPMAALFRIVQDDYPPLPEGISQALRDFLLLCFQKEPMLRKTADKLLEHPWLQNVANVVDPPSTLLPSGQGTSENDADTQVIVNTIKLFQQDVKSNTSKHRPSSAERSQGLQSSKKHPASTSKSSSLRQSSPLLPTVNSGASTPTDGHKSSKKPARESGSGGKSRPHNKGNSSTSAGVQSISKTNSSGMATRVDSSDDENWDDDDEKQNTVRLSDAVGSSKNMSRMNIADIADFVAGDETNWDDEEEDVQVAPTSKAAGRGGHMRNATHVNVGSLVPNLSKYQEKDDSMDDFGLDGSVVDLPKPPTPTTSTKQSKQGKYVSSDGGASMADMLQQRLRQTAVEVDGDAFDDFQFDEHDFQQNETRDVDIRRSREIRQLMSSIKPDSPENDVIEKCNQLLVIFDKHPEQREHLITQHGVLPVLDMLEARSGLRPNIPVLDMLEARSGTVRPHVLRVINKIVEGSARAQEQLSLAGLIPIVMRLLEYSPNPKQRSGAGYQPGESMVDPVVMEAARFVHQISSTTSLTLQMLIGAGGLPVLVHMVAFSHHMTGKHNVPNEDAKRMVYMGLDCIVQVFSVQSSRTRDFCKLFVKLGILPHLSSAFQHVMGFTYNKSLTKTTLRSSGDAPGSVTPPITNSALGDAARVTEDAKYAHRIASIFWIFSRYEVAEQMAREGVLEVIAAALGDSDLTDPVDKFRHLYDHRDGVGKLSHSHMEIVELLLKTVKNLSMEPTALVDLERIGLFNILVPLLDGPIREICKNHVLPCIFNLCRINKRRQEQAALQGLIPHLQRLINEGSHLKQFALPIICDFAHTSSVVRDELWNNNGVVFYINLLKEKYWQTFALNSLAVWLANDKPRVGSLLCEPVNIVKLVDFFRGASTQTINTVHKPLLDMMSKSRSLSRALGRSGLFVLSIIKRLDSSEAIVLRSLLKMLQFIHQHHASPRQLVMDHNLYIIVRGFAKEEGQVLVNQMANRLLRDFQASTMS